MDNWQHVILTALVGLLSAGVGGLVGNAWQRRRTSERSLFLLLRQAFDRPAFRGPYIYQSDHIAFMQAVGLLLKTVETGKYLDRKGEELGDLEGLYRGPFDVRDANRRSVLEEVRDRLQRISHLAKQVAGDATTRTEATIASIDADRDAVVVALNGAWRSLRIGEMRVPTQIQLYEQTQDPHA